MKYLAGLYNRDYFKLTKDEEVEKEVVTKRNSKKLGKLEVYNSSMNFEYPKAVRHYKSLFPNNYMDFLDLYEYEEMNTLNKLYLEEINKNTATELSIKSLIVENKLYHIIGSILKGGQFYFGHHNLYIFPEFQLGSLYRADYLLVGLASGGYQFVFVEMEHPNKNITLADGNYGEAFRKGINQINDWKVWLDSNFSSLTDVFKKSTNKSLPEEFYKYDSSRFHFAVVAGRRKNFSERTYWLKRNEEKKTGIRIFHYDNLYDYSMDLITQKEHGYLSY